MALTIPARADIGFDSVADYTGEAFFAPPSLESPAQSNFYSTNQFYDDDSMESDSKHTIPPFKQLRMRLKERERANQAKMYELAPTVTDIYAGEIETSKYAPKDEPEIFEEPNTKDEIVNLRQ